jgi:hypothetical protein
MGKTSRIEISPSPAEVLWFSPDQMQNQQLTVWQLQPAVTCELDVVTDL